MSKHQVFFWENCGTQKLDIKQLVFWKLCCIVLIYWAVLLNMSEKVKRDEKFTESMSETMCAVRVAASNQTLKIVFGCFCCPTRLQFSQQTITCST